jgi:hypothetical protein
MMPVLSSKFLIQQKPDAGFFSKWRPFHEWNHGFLPVYEWKGLLYVACSGEAEAVEIPDRKIIFVRLDSRSLEALWSEYQASVDNSDVPVGLNTSLLPKAPKKKPADDDIFALLERADDSVGGGPSGDSYDSDSSLDGRKNKVVLSESIDDLLDLSMGDAPPPNLKSKSSSSDKKTDPKKNEKGSAVLAESKPVRAVPTKTEVLLSSKEPPYSEEVTKFAVKALKSAAPEKMDAWVENAFKHMGAHFQKSMILLKQGDQLRPWKWDSAFESEKGDSSSFSLVQPSPFRIVLRSHKPYHGYLVPNDISQKFLAEWNEGQTPEHLTLAPLIVDDHVIGMLLGIGDSASKAKSTLNLAEKIAFQITKEIQSHPRDKKAA